jgi:hypothetical protein
MYRAYYGTPGCGPGASAREGPVAVQGVHHIGCRPAMGASPSASRAEDVVDESTERVISRIARTFRKPADLTFVLERLA